MDWIAVHANVLGGKLRGLWKSVGCSEAEALGALTVLWLWARNNATESGELRNTEEVDIAKAIENSLSDRFDPAVVVKAMIAEGWLDKIDGKLYVHDWAEWQSYWYAYQKRKAKDAERQRRHRLKEKEAEEQMDQENTEAPPPPPPKPKRKKKETPEKIVFAEFVTMTEAEYAKLVEKFGEPFVKKCIEKLDNYKGATKKKYASDYRAILSWVVDEIKKNYPNLIVQAQKPPEDNAGKNTFEEYRNLWS